MLFYLNTENSTKWLRGTFDKKGLNCEMHKKLGKQGLEIILRNRALLFIAVYIACFIAVMLLIKDVDVTENHFDMSSLTLDLYPKPKFYMRNCALLEREFLDTYHNFFLHNFNGSCYLL